MILGITDEKGIAYPKLEHTFLGTVKNNRVSGYHCDKSMGDEKVYAEVHFYPKSKRIVTVNKEQKVFEAYVKDKSTGKMKEENGGKSSFFPYDWSRQDVVDCASRIKKSNRVIKQYRGARFVDEQRIMVDTKTNLVVVDNRAGFFPLLRY